VEPKSHAGQRVVAVAAPLRDHLDEHLLRSGRKGQDLIFARLDGRPFQSTSVVRRAGRPWKAAGLEGIGLHEARHTFASMLIAAGGNALAISKAMAHASVTITYDRYGKLMPGNEEQLAGLFNVYLERDRRGDRTAYSGERRSTASEGSRSCAQAPTWRPSTGSTPRGYSSLPPPASPSCRPSPLSARFGPRCLAGVSLVSSREPWPTSIGRKTRD
jgi:hypothetical protein